MNYFWGFLFCLLVATACKREVEPFTFPTYEYFPLQIGKYITYQVDSIIYNDYSDSVFTHSHRVRYLYSDTSIDAAGNLYYRLECYHQDDTSQNWILRNVWMTLIIDNQAQLVENNQRFVKMVFPIQQNKDWNGLPYIRRDTVIAIEGGEIDFYKDWDNFSYASIDEPMVIGNFSFDSTLTILQVDKENNIERRYAKEQYAKGIGLVYKEMWILDTQCGGHIENCIGKPWELKAEKGFILRQRIIDHNF